MIFCSCFAVIADMIVSCGVVLMRTPLRLRQVDHIWWPPGGSRKICVTEPNRAKPSQTMSSWLVGWFGRRVSLFVSLFIFPPLDSVRFLSLRPLLKRLISVSLNEPASGWYYTLCVTECLFNSLRSVVRDATSSSIAADQEITLIRRGATPLLWKYSK